MENNKILSVLIPSYNMEKYLESCLTSLIIPSIDLIEIIIINDGSTDRTSDIAHKFEHQYPNSIKVIDKRNGNYGSCINVGLKEASGKYVKILDADDSFDNANFEYFVKELTSIDSDLIISDYCKIDETGKVFYNWKFSGTPKTFYLSFDLIIPYILDNNFQMHAVCYRTSNIINIGYKQLENIPYTDQQWMFYPMTTVKRIYYVDKIVYRYLIGREGQTVSSNAYVKNASAMITLCEKLLTDYKSIKYKNEYYDCRLLNCLKGLYYIYLLKKNDINNASIYITRFDKNLKKNFPFFFTKLSEINLYNVHTNIIQKWRRSNYNYNLFSLKFYRYLLFIGMYVNKIQQCNTWRKLSL